MPAKGIKKKTNIPEKVEKEMSTCLMCGENKKGSDFYQNYDSMTQTGKVAYCKKCIRNYVYVNGRINIDKFKDFLLKIDRPFLIGLYQNALNHESDTIGVYMRSISLPKNRSLRWKDSELDDPFIDNTDHGPSDNDEQTYSSDWAGYYTKRDLDFLEEYLFSLKEDFKISTRNHIDYARKIAKASLAMDKAYAKLLSGSGSETTYSKLKEVFDGLSKSAAFAESGRGINDVSLGCFGTTFDKVEKNVWVFKHIPESKDTYDLLLDQFANINKSL